MLTIAPFTNSPAVFGPSMPLALKSPVRRPSTAAEELHQLEAAISLKLRCSLRELIIEVKRGGLVLHGMAYSYYGKQLAQHEVMCRTRRRILANRIEVVPDPTIISG